MAIHKLPDATCPKGPAGVYCGRGRDLLNPGQTYHWHDAKKGDLEDRIAEMKRQAKARKTGVVIRDDKAGLVTVAEFCETFLAAKHYKRVTTHRNVRNAFRLRWCPWVPAGSKRPIGDFAMSEVQTKHIEEWLIVTQRKYAPVPMRVTYCYVKAIFASAYHTGAIARNPCYGPNGKLLKPPKYDNPPAKAKAPKLDDIMAIRDELPVTLRAFVELGAQTGMRSSELLGLDLAEVTGLRRDEDKNKGEIRVRQQVGVVYGEDGQSMVREVVPWTKTPKSRRDIPVGPATLAIIQRHLLANGRSLDAGGLVFQTARRNKGASINYASLSRSWNRAKRKAGVDDDAAVPHGLRHYFASTMLQSGRCSLIALRDILGHETLKETTDTYGHFMPDDADNVRDAVAHIWRDDKPKRLDQLDETGEMK